MSQKEFEELSKELDLLIDGARIEEAKIISVKLAKILYGMLKGYGHNSGIPSEIEIQQIADKFIKDKLKKTKI